MGPFVAVWGRTGFSVGDSKVSVKTNLPQKYKNSSDFIHFILRSPFSLFYKDEKMKKVGQGRGYSPIVPPPLAYAPGRAQEGETFGMELRFVSCSFFLVTH